MRCTSAIFPIFAFELVGITRLINSDVKGQQTDFQETVDTRHRREGGDAAIPGFVAVVV